MDQIMRKNYDAVLDDDMQTLAIGTPKEIRDWLDLHPEAHRFSVCLGESMILTSVQDYLGVVK